MDKGSKSCPDMRSIVSAFKIPWAKIPGGQKWFFDKAEICISEMYKKGYISEEFFDHHDFPIDEDTDGYQYLLKSKADHMVRSKGLYHPNCVKEKKDSIESIISSKETRWLAKVLIAKKIEIDNKECEKHLLTKLGLPVDTPVTNNVFHDTTIQMFDEPNSNLLFAFIKIREVTDLMEPLYRPNKGTLDDVLAGKKDKKGGPFLIQYAFDVRDKNPKGKIQEEPDFNPPEVVQSPPTIEKFVNLSLDMELEKITFEWCLKAKSCVQNLFVLNMERYKNRIEDHMDSFNEHVDILIKKILKRFRKYAVDMIPPSRIDLMPGKH